MYIINSFAKFNAAYSSSFLEIKTLTLQINKLIPLSSH